MISESTLYRLLRGKCPADTIALMCFYGYLMRQNHDNNEVTLTTAQTAELLKWSAAKLRRTKNILRNMGMIADTTVRSLDGRITYHCVKILAY